MKFEEEFFDVRKHGPKPGQVLAKFSAMADFVDDWVKQNVVAILTKAEGGALSAMKVMRNSVGATELDAIRVPLEMCKDLAENKTIEEVLMKPYRFKMEKFYWTKKDNVPSDNPHWSLIEVKKPLSIEQ